MLQQTRVEAAVPYYLRFVARWPTLEALAAAPDGEVFAAWSGLGYYARCRNLLRAARTAVREHGGLPGSLAALRALPGFGPYTAGAVASIAFALPAAAVDGNVARVLARLFHLRGEPGRTPFQRRVWQLARELVGEAPGGRRARPPEAPGDWNQALMELGATLCGRAPACPRCPLLGLCEARRAGVERAVPRPRRRPRRTAVTVACAVVERRGMVLLVRQPEGGLFAGLLGLPAALVPEGAGPAAALRQALGARGLRVRTGPELGAARRTLTHRELELRAISCAVEALPQGFAAHGGGAWVAREDLGRAGLPAAMLALLRAVEEGEPRRRALGLAFPGAVV
jgi:A/G-specific adenine glycosylase